MTRKASHDLRLPDDASLLFRMMVEVPVVGKVGDRLTSYFPDFGKFDGCISDTKPRGFLLELEIEVPSPSRPDPRRPVTER